MELQKALAEGKVSIKEWQEDAEIGDEDDSPFRGEVEMTEMQGSNVQYAESA